MGESAPKVPKGPKKRRTGNTNGRKEPYRNWLTSGMYSNPASARVRRSSDLLIPSAAQSSSRSGYWSRNLVLMRLKRMNGSMGIGV